jgi:putative glutamine amidotransferase
MIDIYTTKNKPLIGITTDTGDDNSYSPYPWYALRQNYVEYISNNGGVPIILPHHPEHAQRYAEIIDGLLITGGDFDISPNYWGGEIISDTVKLNPQRTEFEMEMAKIFLSQDKPILGICNGQQLLNVLLGGSLIQHIPDAFPDALEHSQKNPRHQAAHDATILGDTLLANIVGNNAIKVNSSHHQAVDKIADELVINAIAPDNIIEGLEHPHKRFVMGVQWHPEYVVSDADRLIVKRFIAACQKTK